MGTATTEPIRKLCLKTAMVCARSNIYLLLWKPSQLVSTPFPHHTTHPVIVLSSTLIISGIPLPRAGLHQTMADKGAEILGDNIAKVPAIMSDNAAKDVADKMFIIKDRVVQLLKTYEDDFTDEQLEVMATKFVDTCITHTGDLASKKHHNAM